MNPIDLSSVIPKIRKVIENHKLADGQYGRYLGDTEPNPYGCADAANILYSIGDFPKCPAERAEWVKTLCAMQDPETGLFTEPTHHTIHTTAHCMAAIELFDAVPAHRAYALEQYMPREKMEAFFDELLWVDSPWNNSHRGAGLYVALNLGGSEGVEQFNKNYFDWLWENADPDTGFWKKGCQNGVRPAYEHMAGSFHYLFNHEHAHMPLRYPDKVIDECIAMYDNKELPKTFGKQSNFLEIDWIFCLTRAQQQTSHRWDEVTDRLEKFAVEYADFWLNVDYDTDKTINDLHRLFGGVCGLTELQRALRGRILTDKPLKLVLDRRPFI